MGLCIHSLPSLFWRVVILLSARCRKSFLGKTQQFSQGCAGGSRSRFYLAWPAQMGGLHVSNLGHRPLFAHMALPDHDLSAETVS